MRYHHDRWEETKKRMLGYWQREEMDRCNYTIALFPAGKSDPVRRNYYFDTDEADRAYRARFEDALYFGEAMPSMMPYFGTGGIAEYTGCKATRVDHTTWFDPWLDEPDASLIGFTCPKAFDDQVEAVRRLLHLAGNDYFVTVSDNCGILDALSSIRGTDELMMDMLTEPEFVEEAVDALLPIYRHTQETLFDLVRQNNEGAVHSWMHLWAPGRLAQMQCDLSVMISKEMFDRFAMRELEALCNYLEYPVYHFDGQEQIRHLDSLLSIPNLRAIQWTPVAGQPRTSDFIPVFQKIQKAGKNLVLSPRPDEVEKLLDNLSSVGLHMNIVGVETEEEARDMIRLITAKSKARK